MLVIKSTHTAQQAQNPNRSKKVLKALGVMIVMVAVWRQRAETRRQLASLDPRLLQDIGLTKAQAQQESAKPFWKP